MILHNRYYGHSSILARYAGLDDRVPPIFGSVMHGWQPDPSDQYLRGARWSSRVPIFMWNEEHLASARRRGHPNLLAIGSPFAYLMALEPDLRSGPESSGTVVIAPHSSDDAPISEAVFREVKRDAERSCSPPWDLIAFYQDWVNVPFHLFESEPDWQVHSFGRRFDPLFLTRLLARFASRRQVYSPTAFSSAFLYALSIGLDPCLGELGVGITALEETRQRGAVHSAWPSRLRRAIESGSGRDLADSQLGTGLLLEPEKLRVSLGWTGVRKRVSPVLARFAHAYSGHRAVRVDQSYPYPGPTL